MKNEGGNGDFSSASGLHALEARIDFIQVCSTKAPLWCNVAFAY